MSQGSPTAVPARSGGTELGSAGSPGPAGPLSDRRARAALGKFNPGVMLGAVGRWDWTYRILAFVLLAGSWQLFAEMDGGLLIPTFLETMEGLFRLLGDSATWEAFAVSNQALALGFLFSVVVGIPVGLALGRFRRAERLLDVYLDILLVIPMAALIPILVMSTGIGLLSRVILVVLFSIVMVIVNARAGVRQVPPALIEMALSLGATERQIWRKILLPAALPAIMTGVRIGLGRAITGMIIVELLMVSVGLGGLMIEFRAFFRGPELYATVILVVVESLLLITAVRKLEEILMPWARTPRNVS
jgi:ABC-type nitrate/sulfonate/bicarbonate transport system permease component